MERYPTASIIVQSFGGEIPKFMKIFKERYPNFPVNDNIFDFDSYLSMLVGPMETKIKTLVTELKTRIKPGHLVAFRNSYETWTKHNFGKPLFFDDNTHTIFFDDNAVRCATIIDECSTPDVDGHKDDIITVSTANALMNDEYLKHLLRLRIYNSRLIVD